MGLSAKTQTAKMQTAKMQPKTEDPAATAGGVKQQLLQRKRALRPAAQARRPHLLR